MKISVTILSAVLTLTVITGCDSSSEMTEGHHEHAVAEQPRGPHGGKLFEADGFQVEVTIYEPEIPPQSRIYLYDDDEPLDPSLVTVTTELHRIDRVDTIRYRKQDDYLQGDSVVAEPHSFDVVLKAAYKGKEHRFEYSSYEGRTTISGEAMKSSGIETEKAGGTTISTSVLLNGRITPDKLKTSALTPRFAGIVREIRHLPGSTVQKGDILATIEANDSLKTYDLVAPRAGEVLDATASVGELVTTNQPIFTVGDLSSVWVELAVPKSDFSKLKVGQKVLISREGGNEPLAGKIIYLSSVADGDTQTRLARAEVQNPGNILVPELFVEAKVVINERQVPVAIKAESLQSFRDWDVVFRKVGQIFEIAILELGERDGDWIEVRKGLSPGDEYVTRNSFVVKADVMKSGATHDH